MDQANQFAAYLSLRKYASKPNAVANKATHSQSADLDSLYETALSLSSYLEANAVYKAIVYRGCKLADTEHGFIYIVNRDEDMLELKYGTGIYSHYLGVRRAKEEPSVSSTVWRTGRPLAVDHLAVWDGRAKDRPYGWDAVKSVLGIPLYSGTEVTAVIGLGFGVSKMELRVEEMDLLSRFAALASLSLHNAQLFGSHQMKKVRPVLLTTREKEIAKFVASGLSNRCIATTLYIAEVTVKKALQNIYGKLGVNNRTALTKLMLEKR